MEHHLSEANLFKMKTQILFVWQNVWKAKSADFKLINTVIKNKNQIHHFIIEKFPQTM